VPDTNQLPYVALTARDGATVGTAYGLAHLDVVTGGGSLLGCQKAALSLWAQPALHAV